MSGKDPCKQVPHARGYWLLRVFAAFWCVAPTTCSGNHPIEAEATATAALIAGKLSPAERDAVVFIRANHPNGAFDDCTGTLLSPHVVVTAKHCVTLVQPGEFVCNGSGVLVENGQGAGLFGAKVDGDKIEVHIGAAPVGAAAAHVAATFSTDSGDACHDDVAALVLDKPIHLDNYPSLRASRATVVGERVRLVGYGTVGHDTLIERREIDDVRVLDVGRDDGVQNPNATTPARSFVVGGGTACFGDSGGPALSMDTGALIGVYSRITGDCFALESRNTFMLAGSFSKLLARAFELAGEQPLLEPALEAPPTEPKIDAGSGGSAAGQSGAGGVVGSVGSGGASGGAEDSGGTAGATGSGIAAGSTEALRHESLRCSVRRSRGASSSSAALWLMFGLVAEFSRRRFARRPF